MLQRYKGINRKNRGRYLTIVFLEPHKEETISRCKLTEFTSLVKSLRKIDDIENAETVYNTLWEGTFIDRSDALLIHV